MTDDAAEATDNRIQATSTSLELLDAVRRHDGIRFGDLVEAVDVSKSTVHHHLATLRDHGFVVEEDGVYHVGLRTLEYGGHARRRQRLYQICKGQADDLAAELDETVQLVVEERGWGVYVYQAGDEVNSSHTRTGTRTPLHATAAGKAILSALPAERVDDFVADRDLAAETENTITDVDVLKAELAEIRDQGYALDDEESFVGLRCVAKPVVTTDDEVLGAISVSGSVDQVDDTRFRVDLPEYLTNTAAVARLSASYDAVIDPE